MTNSDGTGTRKARRWVLIADKVADRVISIGGIAVIGAVFGIMIFLVAVVLPLFKGGKAQSHNAFLAPEPDQPVLGLAVDEFKAIAAKIGPDGKVVVWHPATGTPLKTESFDLEGKQVTAFSQGINPSNVAFGFSDGTVRLGRLIFETEIFGPAELPDALKVLDERDSTDGSAVYSRIPGDQTRKCTMKLALDPEIKVSETGSPIMAMDYRFTRFGGTPKQTLAVMDQARVGTLVFAESKLNRLTRKMTLSTEKIVLPPLKRDAAISHALINELATDVLFGDKNGRVYRFNIRDPSSPHLAETAQVLTDGVQLNILAYLLGETSIVVGGSDGSVNIYFVLRRNEADSSDGYALVHTRSFEPQRSAIVAFAPSRRGKVFATADAQGEVWVRQGTTCRTLLKLKEPRADNQDTRMTMAPRDDALLAARKGGMTDFWNLELHYPEISLGTLFGKVWYEGYGAPSYTWQSSGATEAFEPKLSLIPLIFGTLKATFYSLLFSIPIAILAAIYTSEFLSPNMRGKLKPVIEVMASVPSVVLGFIAALVLAPFVETWIVAVILAFGVLPTTLMLAAYLWQMLPPRMAVRFDGTPKFIVMFVVVGLGLYSAYLLAPIVESWAFGGDFKGWLNGRHGEATPFLFLLLTPLSALGVSILSERLIGSRIKRHLIGFHPFWAAALDLGRWSAIALLTVGLSYAGALILQKLGLDARGSVIGDYMQRNTMVVGFAMGFAVIPIIYTLAEDALNAVPEHLRAASLGCGATPWQTAIWIILPTAISGVFSAVMIGMGRAVGETMIVVMATGNTPLIDMSIFDGLRALSANIAVELPEAPKGDTLYRLLFMTGLVLFAMTFVINTVAEIVRMHFRKRASQL